MAPLVVGVSAFDVLIGTFQPVLTAVQQLMTSPLVSLHAFFKTLLSHVLLCYCLINVCSFVLRASVNPEMHASIPCVYEIIAA